MKCFVKWLCVAGVSSLTLATEIVPTLAAANETGTVEFRVGSTASRPISGARVIVISDEGKILATGRTDESGRWTVTMPLEVDPRFQGQQPVDTVTSVAVANGYNEEMMFEIPVTAHTVQPIILSPIIPNARNEPSTGLGNLHRHDIISTIDAYATRLRLKRQPPIPGEQGYAPWSPDMSR